MTADATVDPIEFLRRSLADLDAELAAGELTPRDHARLKDDYTARLAAALRGEGEAPVDASVGAGPVRGRRGPWARRVLGGGLVLALAVGAGVAVARTSGTRTSQDSLTGDIRQTQRGDLDRCLELASRTEVLESVRCYDEVLAADAASVEALTYRAWVLVRTGDERLLASAEENLDRAVALDPAYPDARAFRAVLLSQLGRPAEAQAELDAFDALGPPPLMRDLIAQFQLRERIEAQLAGG